MSEQKVPVREIIEALESLEKSLQERQDDDLLRRLGTIVQQLRAYSPVSEDQPSQSSVRMRVPPVEKCPRCTLRSLHAEVQQQRVAPDRPAGREMLWHCSSCGHEVWRPIKT